MKARCLTIAAAAGLLIGSTAVLQAQSGGRMGGGASSAAPGHGMNDRKSPGAARVAPGHEEGTTGAGDRDDRMTGSGAGRDDDDLARHDTDGMMDNDRRGTGKE